MPTTKGGAVSASTTYRPVLSWMLWLFAVLIVAIAILAMELSLHNEQRAYSQPAHVQSQPTPSRATMSGDFLWIKVA